MPFTLSKTRYCNAVQCPKMLWLRQNMPEAFDDQIPFQYSLHYQKRKNGTLYHKEFLAMPGQ